MNNIGRDSMRKCDYSANPFDLRMEAHPGVKQQRAERYQQAQDTLLPSQMRMEEKVFLHLKGKGNKEGKHPLLHPINLGKYLFIVVFFPPYLLFYGGPKWMLQVVTPKVFKSVKKLWHKSAEQFSPLANRMKRLLQRGMERGVDLKAWLLKLGKKGQGKIPRNLLERTFNPLKRLIPHFSFENAFSESSMGKKLSTWASSLADSFKKVGEGLKSSKGRIQCSLREGFQPFKEGLKPLYYQNRVRIEKMEAFLQQMASEVAHRLKGVYHKIVLTPFEKVNHKLQEVSSAVNHVVQPITQFVAKQKTVVIERLQALNERYLEWKKRVKETVEPITKKVETAQTWVLNHVIPQPVISLFIPLISWVKRVQEKPKQRRLSIVARIRKGKMWLKEHYHHWKLQAQFLKSRVRRHLKEGKRVVKEVIGKGYRLFREGLIIAMTLLQTLFFVFRLMLAWLFAFIRYGVVTSRELLSFYLRAS